MKYGYLEIEYLYIVWIREPFRLSGQFEFAFFACWNGKSVLTAKTFFFLPENICRRILNRKPEPR